MKPAAVYVTAIDMCIVGYLDFEHHKHALLPSPTRIM